MFGELRQLLYQIHFLFGRVWAEHLVRCTGALLVLLLLQIMEWACTEEGRIEKLGGFNCHFHINEKCEWCRQRTRWAWSEKSALWAHQGWHSKAAEQTQRWVCCFVRSVQVNVAYNTHRVWVDRAGVQSREYINKLNNTQNTFHSLWVDPCSLLEGISVEYSHNYHALKFGLIVKSVQNVFCVLIAKP